jgi:hypothetical protein
MSDAATEVHMALVIIEDLPQSDDLDREAMRSITGGARSSGARLMQFDQAEAEADSGRIVNYPSGFGPRGPIASRLRRSAG